MADVSLTVGKKIYEGWKRARVTLGIESIAGVFELEVADRFAADRSRDIVHGDECVISIGDQKVITGYVDVKRVSIGPEEHTLQLAGRDKTGDLVDCSAILDKWEFSNISPVDLATKIATPFGITTTLVGAKPNVVPKLSIDPGDSAHEIIERACRFAGLLPISDGNGALVLTRPGTEHASDSLIEGQNILAASVEYDNTGRFYEYRVRGQSPGTDLFSGKPAAHVTGKAYDYMIAREARKLLIRAEAGVNSKQAKTRAEWEATVRASRGDSAEITVAGWTQTDGKIWPINGLVNVKSPKLGIAGEMLITQAMFSVDSGGSKTQLTLRRPDAFILQPIIRKPKAVVIKELANGA